jgi:hypothetical protein
LKMLEWYCMLRVFILSIVVIACFYHSATPNI